MLRRKMVSFESGFLPSNYNIAVGLRVRDKKDVNIVAEKLAKSFCGFHTHIDGDEFVFKPRDVPVYKLPSNINSLKDQIYYLESNFMKNPSQIISSIAVSDDSVVFSATHGIYDGTTIKDFITSISDGKELPNLKLPDSIFDPFLKEIQSTKCTIPNYFTDKEAVRFISSDNNFKSVPGNSTVVNEILYDNEFQIYDKKDKALHGLTEASFASLVLAVSALNGKFDKTGLWEVIGMRNYASKNLELRQGQYIANIPVSIKATTDTTIREMMRLYRKDMKEKLANKATFQFLKGMKDGFPEAPVINGAPVILSSIGNFPVHGPLTDAYMMTTSYGDVPFAHLPMIMYSVDNGIKKKFVLSCNYSTKMFSAREAKAFTNLTAYSLKNIDLNMKIGEAVDKLIEVKKEIFKLTNSISRVIKF